MPERLAGILQWRDEPPDSEGLWIGRAKFKHAPDVLMVITYSAAIENLNWSEWSFLGPLPSPTEGE